MKAITFPKFKIIIAVSFIILSLSSCRLGFNEPYPLSSSNNVVEEVIPLQNFNRLEMGNAFKVYVKRGNNFSIIAKGDDYDIRDLEALVTNGLLKLRYKNYVARRYQMIVYITMPHLVEANFSGAVWADITNFNENEMFINASGATDIFIDSDAKYWEIDLSGASNLEVLGSGRDLFLEASGSSDVRLSNLRVDNIGLDLSGASRAWLFAYNEILGRASGSSEVRFRGNPLVDISLSGSSWVTKE